MLGTYGFVTVAITLTLNVFGFFYKANQLAFIEVQFFSVYGYYGGFLIYEHFTKLGD